jgi:hypothetical protein
MPITSPLDGKSLVYQTATVPHLAATRGHPVQN